VPISQTGLMLATMLVMQVVTNVYYVRAGLWRIIWESETPSERDPQHNRQRTSTLADAGR
jgi:hypothetical protein